MKAKSVIPCRSVFALIALISLLLTASASKGQGRVLINEYLAWAGKSCPVTAEYIELYNFGPGPMNIGCYILTDGDYSITIPANIILLPGQFYLIAGQSTISLTCDSTSPPIPVNLNWNNCSNCTSAPIPTTGDGFMTDGGNGSEQLVLLDPNLSIVDAIVRDVPESSSTITTASTAGCSSKTFNLSTMRVRYERVGESQGRANSFARKVNGGCGWLKDTQQSPGQDNNTTGNTPQFTASVTTVQPVDCTEKGMASIQILNANYSTVFPMKYLLGKDIDSNSVYNEFDLYSSGVDSVPTNIELTNLDAGLYKVVVETQDGCDLQALNFSILNCVSVPLYPIDRTPFGINQYNEKLLISSITNSSLELTIQKQNGSRDQLRFMDLTGRILYQQEYMLRRGNTIIKIPVSILQGSSYIIQWRNGQSGVVRNLKFSRHK
jgi:hypothetical protein